jgi:hypothetical protein
LAPSASRGRDQFAGLALGGADEPILKAGGEPPLDLTYGPQYFARRIDVAPLRHQRPMQATMPASASLTIQGSKPAVIAIRRAAAYSAKRFTTAPSRQRLGPPAAVAALADGLRQ